MSTTQRSVLVVILSVTFTGVLGNTVLAPAIPDVLDHFGVGDGGAGVLIAATSFPGVMLAPVVGLLADRLGRRRVLVPCLVIYGTAGLCAAAAPTFELLVAARLGMGVGAAGLINLAVVLIGDFWDGDARTKMIGRNAAFLTTCLAIVPPIAGLLTDLVSWRLAMSLYGFGLLTAVLAWRVLDPAVPDTTVTIREQLSAVRQVVKARQVLLIYACSGVSFALIFGVFLAALPLHLEEEFGYGASIRGLFLASVSLPSTLAAFNLHRLRATFGTRTTLILSGLLFALGFALMGLGTVAVLVVAGCVVYGLGEGAAIPTLQDVAITITPPEHRGAVVALYVSATRLGQTIGPLGAAALFAATSTFTALRAGAAVALVLMAMLAMIRDPARPGRPGAAADR